MFWQLLETHSFIFLLKLCVQLNVTIWGFYHLRMTRKVQDYLNFILGERRREPRSRLFTCNFYFPSCPNLERSCIFLGLKRCPFFQYGTIAMHITKLFDQYFRFQLKSCKSSPVAFQNKLITVFSQGLVTQALCFCFQTVSSVS